MNHFGRQSVVNSVDGNIQAWLQDSSRNYFIDQDAQFKLCKMCDKQIPWNQDYCRECWLEATGLDVPII